MTDIVDGRFEPGIELKVCMRLVDILKRHQEVVELENRHFSNI